MNIAFFGSSLVSAYWNGAATYYRGIIKALHRFGHRICFYEPDAYNRQQHRDMKDPSWARVVVYAPEERALFRCLEEARDADVVVKASGIGVFDDLLEREVANLRRPGTTTVYWDVDAPNTLDRMDENPSDPLREEIPRYDLVLTYGGGSRVVDAFLALGAKQCEPVYNAFDPDTHHPAPKEERFGGDFGFLGNRLPDRESRVEEFFLRPAGAMKEKRFLLGGNGWEDKSVPENVRRLGHVYTGEHNAFNSTLTAVLNINRDSMARYGHSPATRVFEAAGAGACLVTDDFPGVEEFFEPDREILVARDGEEVREVLSGLTAEKARSIGQAALRRALFAHTYARRARRLHELLNSATRGAFRARVTEWA